MTPLSADPTLEALLRVILFAVVVGWVCAAARLRGK